jgi:AraC family transcriptional regulator
MLGASQFTVAIHEGTPFEMEWRLPEKRQMERRRIVSGDLHINPADQPLFQRWTTSPRILVIALEQTFIEQVVHDAFDGNEPALRTVIGIRDPVIEGMAAAWRRELAERGAGGRLYTEGLGSALAVHLFRAYGDGLRRAPLAIGGLGALRLRRVADYIEARLAEDVSLSDLAAVAGLSTHHFGEAFKTSTGRSPHRYLIERRIRRGKELLLGADRSIAEVALAIGFASHSHFTDNFRKLTGTTPSRFRIDRS